MARRKTKEVYLMPEPKWASIHTQQTEEDKQKLLRNFEYYYSMA